MTRNRLINLPVYTSSTCVCVSAHEHMSADDGPDRMPWSAANYPISVLLLSNDVYLTTCV